MLGELLDALNQQSLASDAFEVIIVDDGSKVPVAPELAKRRDRYALRVLTQQNAGAAAARHAGVLEAKAPIVVITDDVTETERDEYLRLFSHRPAEQGEATRWLSQFMRNTRMKQPHIEELPGYEELFQKLDPSVAYSKCPMLKDMLDKMLELAKE